MGDRLWVGTSSRYVTRQPGQLSLASLRGRLIEYQLRLGVKAGMSPLPGGSDTIWQVSSRSGVQVRLRTAISVYFTLLFLEPYLLE